MNNQSPSVTRNGLKRERVSCNVECWKLLGVVYLIHINVLFHLDVCSSVVATHLKDNKFMFYDICFFSSWDHLCIIVGTHVLVDPSIGYFAKV